MSRVDDIEQRLFEKARGEAPSPDLRARILAQGKARGLERRAAGRRRPSVFVGVGLGLAAAAALAVVLSQPAVPPGDVVPRAEPTPKVSRPLRQQPSPPTPVAKPLPSQVEVPRVVDKPARPKQRSLAEQLELLRLARQSLRAGDARGALGVLDQYAARTNSVDMSAEATLLRIEAMQALGQHEQAKNLADSFVARSPNNPLVDRARSLTSGRTEETAGMGRETEDDENEKKGTTN